MIVMGGAGNYNDFFSSDVKVVDAFIDLKTPVWVIPSHVSYRPIKKNAFACNNYRKNLQTPVSLLRRLVQLTNAILYVIHVVHPSEFINKEAQKIRDLLQRSLTDLSPVYYEPAFDNVFNAKDHFTEEENIDFHLVIPGRPGYGIKFFKSVVGGWKKVVRELGIPRAEQELMSPALRY